MKKSVFHYHLPSELIASHPPAQRTGSRLLQLQGTAITHGQFPDLLDHLEPGDLMVFNNTRVIPARLFAKKASGGACEVLVERVVSASRVLAHVRASRSPKVGSDIILGDQVYARVTGRQDALFCLELTNGESWPKVLEAQGHMPLPPYIERADTATDKARYQTVYAKHPGAVAAPTAGLHFDQPLLDAIRDKGVSSAEVTLHVGAGTFQPVRSDDIEDHRMHSEWMQLTPAVAKQIVETRERGHRVIAVGTTSVRCLETWATRSNADVDGFEGDTNIFIYPGYEFKVVDKLITNFHLPESTLMMLVSAFSGYSAIMQAYREAIAERYRFFSYGDAMLLSRNPNAIEDQPADTDGGQPTRENNL